MREEINVVDVTSEELDPLKKFESIIMLPFKTIGDQKKWVQWYTERGRKDFLGSTKEKE